MNLYRNQKNEVAFDLIFVVYSQNFIFFEFNKILKQLLVHVDEEKFISS